LGFLGFLGRVGRSRHVTGFGSAVLGGGLGLPTAGGRGMGGGSVTVGVLNCTTLGIGGLASGGKAGCLRTGGGLVARGLGIDSGVL
jgi:hypothetical protein